MRDERDYTNRKYSEEDSRSEGNDTEPIRVTSPTEKESNGPRTTNGRITNAQKVRIRKRPSLSADVLQIVDEGTIVRILNRDGDFYRIRFNTNELGFVHCNYCKEL